MNDEIKLLAFAGVAPAKLVAETKRSLPCGYRTAFKLRAEIEGIITKGDATDKAATCKVDPIAFAAELVHRLKLTKTEAETVVAVAASASLQEPEQAKSRACAGWVEQAIIRGQETARPYLPRVPVDGSVKVVHSRVEVQEIE